MEGGPRSQRPGRRDDSMRNYEVISGYRGDDKLRASFNQLAGETFGLDFEDWYQNGYWSDAYNPYSIVIDGEVAANVSVNRTDFIWKGEKIRLIQLGTVMTREKYRNMGLSRRIMDEVLEDCKQADGIYLFANDSVLDFYPRFGFRRAEEYQYKRELAIGKEGTMRQVPMREKKDWDRVERAVRDSACNSALNLDGNSGLIMFYLTKFMRENVYYDEALNAYAVAEREGEELLLYQVFSEEKADILRVAQAFGKEVKRVGLGFTPLDADGFKAERLCQEDTTLFVRGRVFDDLEAGRFMIPLLAYA